MKIVVISDSHGNKIGINKIFQDIMFDYLFFLGDGLGDLGDYIYLDNVFVVSGNCDFFSSVPNERIFNLNGERFLITHGNKYSVKSTLNYLKEKAVSEEVDFALFGHTHRQLVENYNDITFINPGTFQKNYQKQARGLILDIKDKNNFKLDNFVIDL